VNVRPAGLVVMVMPVVAEKLAVTLRGADMVTPCGLVLPDRSPLQFAKTYPLDAEAVSCTGVPLL
jgi:hypothetical protein